VAALWHPHQDALNQSKIAFDQQQAIMSGLGKLGGAATSFFFPGGISSLGGLGGLSGFGGGGGFGNPSQLFPGYGTG
jgi:hypothetical protein